jgi:hypothetical protein
MVARDSANRSEQFDEGFVAEFLHPFVLHGGALLLEQKFFD